MLAFLALFAIVAGSVFSQTAVQQTGVDKDGNAYVRGHILVGLEDGLIPQQVKKGTTLYGGIVGLVLPEIDAALIVYPASTDIFEKIAEISNQPFVRYAEPDFIRYATFTPNDPSWNQQWGPKKIKCDLAWDVWKGDPNCIIAIVDTGINYNHPDLASKYIGGYDFYNNDNDPMDDNGHGTHCSGIAAGATNNNVGIAGVGFNCRLRAYKVLGAGGSGSDSQVVSGIDQAVADGAHVISLSLGRTGYSSTMANAVANAWNAGVVVCCAAGNNGNTTLFYPAAYTQAIAVASTDSDDTRSYFSDYGASWVDVAAPGSNIYSTYSASYGYLSGTSMACPHVAGVAGLVYSYVGLVRDVPHAQLVRDKIESNCDYVGTFVSKGRVNAYLALTGSANGISTQVTVSSASGPVGATVTLSAKLSRSYDGAPISGKQLSFTVAGVPVNPPGTTDPSGFASVQYKIPESQGGLIPPIGAQFAGDGTYGASSGNNILTVSRASTLITVTPVGGSIGQTVSLTAHLTRTTDGASVVGRQLSFAVNGSPVGSPQPTDGSGNASVQYKIPESLGIGQASIQVNFAGDTAYLPTSATGSLTVSKANAALAVGDQSAQIGATATLTATLTRTTDNGLLSGKTVAFTVGGNSAGSAVTDANAVASRTYVVPESLGVGPKTIFASFGGDSLYIGTTGNGTLTVNKAGTNIQVSNVSGAIGETVALTASLHRTTDNMPLSGRTLSFSVNGFSVGNAVTAADGAASISYYIPENLGVGTATITVQFSGDATHDPSGGSGNLPVTKAGSAISVAAVTGQIGQTVVLSATLHRTTDGATLPGRILDLSVAGVVVGSGTTNASGSAQVSFTIPESLGVGGKAILVSFAGDSTTLSSAGQGLLSVLRADTSIAVPDVDGMFGFVVPIYAQLRRTTDGALLAGRSLTFKIEGPVVGSVTKIGTAKTNAFGFARLDYLVPWRAGTTIVVEFAGDANDNPSPRATGHLRLGNLELGPSLISAATSDYTADQLSYGLQGSFGEWAVCTLEGNANGQPGDEVRRPDGLLYSGFWRSLIEGLVLEVKP